MTLPGQITGVHTVGVPVTNQDRAIDFYVGTLSSGRSGVTGHTMPLEPHTPRAVVRSNHNDATLWWS
jgi:catechol 2,3-dioxygenase-like lactoylglutathione lyase family enzyme